MLGGQGVEEKAHISLYDEKAKNILKNGAPAVAAYKEFLSAGCTKSPIELLKIAGVNLETPQPIQVALNVLNEILDEMESLTL